MFSELNLPVSNQGVAEFYGDLLHTLVVEMGLRPNQTPASYEDVYLDEDKSFDFSIAVRAPLDATGGLHVFHVGLYCDGVLRVCAAF